MYSNTVTEMFVPDNFWCSQNECILGTYLKIASYVSIWRPTVAESVNVEKPRALTVLDGRQFQNLVMFWTLFSDPTKVDKENH